MKPEQLRARQRSTLFTALLMFSLLLILLQLWLFVSVLESLIHRTSSMTVPAAVASVFLFAINIWMLRGVSALSSRK